MRLSIHTEMYPHCFKQEAFSGSIGRYVFERIALLYLESQNRILLSRNLIPGEMSRAAAKQAFGKCRESHIQMCP